MHSVIRVGAMNSWERVAGTLGEVLGLFGWQTSFQNCVGSGDGRMRGAVTRRPGVKAWTCKEKALQGLGTVGTMVVTNGL